MPAMTPWNASHYLRYGDQRTRPAAELAARINLDAPRTVVDLGCGPGNSTALLWRRWPEAEVVGVDHSPEMIAAANEAHPDRRWEVGDVAAWNPPAQVDLVFSNAALHWLPDHDALLRRLLGGVARGGALAFQIPSATFPRVRHLIHELSRDPAWDARMAGPRERLTMETPAFYYDALARDAGSVDLWETEYQHVIDGPSAVIEWVSATGLRPFLAALDTDAERDTFVSALRQRVDDAYDVRADGKVLFPFRRTFAVAYR